MLTRKTATNPLQSVTFSPIMSAVLLDPWVALMGGAPFPCTSAVARGLAVHYLVLCVTVLNWIFNGVVDPKWAAPEPSAGLDARGGSSLSA